jgi:hypothetical protein
MCSVLFPNNFAIKDHFFPFYKNYFISILSYYIVHLDLDFLGSK